MNRKRGAPVLIELIARPSGPSIGGPPATPSDGAGRGGSAVSNPANWGGAADRPAGRGDGLIRRDLRLPAMLIGGGIVVVVFAAIIGYQLGQKKERQGWANDNAGGSGPGQSGSPVAPLAGPGVRDPLNEGGIAPSPNAAGGAGFVRPLVPNPGQPVTEMGLQDGWNYLVVATLRRADAEEAATYLKDNGVPVQLVPYKNAGVDRGGGDANNGRWQLWILRGVPRGEYSKSQPERDALKSKVEMLGRTWKAKNRQAPTDFSGSFWQLKS
ncbi:MAG: hypothetical protein Q8L55_04105 [Phycisphaerales bacterium]|nr:hypothetical protein [Phycisphaerales bacterium]